MKQCHICRFHMVKHDEYPCKQCNEKSDQMLPYDGSFDCYKQTIEELEAALMETIASPKGVVPDSAMIFYRRNNE